MINLSDDQATTFLFRSKKKNITLSSQDERKKGLLLPLYFSLLIIGSFLGTFFLFFWGRQTKSYCFDEDEKVSEVYHALLHLLSSVGHHLIIIA